jgi:hypothetical protein
VRMNNVGFVFVMSGRIAVASLIGGGSSTQLGIGSHVQLTGVDEKPLPFVIASTTSDQSLVTGGNAVLGETIATGSQESERFANTLPDSLSRRARFHGRPFHGRQAMGGTLA